MTPEQERAEARLDKAKLLEWIDQRRVKASTKEAHDEVVRIERSIKRGAFDSNSLDREEQLIAEKEELRKNYRTLADDWSIVTTDRDEAIAKVAEQDKEIQRLREALISERDEAMKWDGVGTVNRINKTLNQS